MEGVEVAYLCADSAQQVEISAAETQTGDRGESGASHALLPLPVLKEQR